MLLHHSHCSLLNDALQRKDALRHSYRFSRLNTASHRCAPPLPPITERPDESAIRLAPEASRDDRIVVIYYPILSCFWKMISVSDPNPVLVEIILSVSENYPKVHCDAQHTSLCFVYFASWGKITSGVILPSAGHDWLKLSHDKFGTHVLFSWTWHL